MTAGNAFLTDTYTSPLERTDGRKDTPSAVGSSQGKEGGDYSDVRGSKRNNFLAGLPAVFER